MNYRVEHKSTIALSSSGEEENNCDESANIFGETKSREQCDDLKGHVILVLFRWFPHLASKRRLRANGSVKRFA